MWPAIDGAGRLLPFADPRSWIAVAVVAVASLLRFDNQSFFFQIWVHKTKSFFGNYAFHSL
jgi:hypothetical protein